MPQARNRNLSLIRIIACMAVVLLHTANLAMAYFEPQDTARIITASMRNLMLWSVPCFVMVTGALLLDPAREISYKKLFGKYISRIVTVLLIFTLIYRLTDCLIDKTPIGADFITGYLSDVVFGTSWSHVWYLYLMIAIYLLLPFSRMISSKADAKDMRYLVIVLIIFQSLATLVSDITGKELAFYICVSTVFPIFLFAGYAITGGQIRIPKIICIIASVISISGIVIISIKATQLQSPMLGLMVTSYHFILTVILSIAVFTIIYSIASDPGKKSGRVFASLDGSTFGIYLVHMIVLNIIYKVPAFNPYTIGVYILPVIALITFVISWGVVAALRLIPFVRKLL